ncbi:MAG: alpha/beta fold hydrolase [Mycetocola sp.]
MLSSLSDDWPLPHRFTTTDGEVRWARVGSGPAMVLTHGSPFSSIVWRDIIEPLSAEYTVYVWDLLGSGQSEQRDGQDVSIAGQSAILRQLIDHWGVASPRAVGHDIGGAITLGAHLWQGVDYADMTLIDAVAGGHWGTGFFKLLRDNEHIFSRLPDYAHLALVRSHLERASARGYRPGDMELFLEPWRGDRGRAAFYRQYAQATEEQTDRIQAALGLVSVPTRVLWWRQDELLTEPFARLLRDGIRHADFHWLENAGHLAQWDAAAEVATHVLKPHRPVSRKAVS